jgi:hypothetical protein
MPSNEMRFKTNDNRVIYHGNIHFRDELFQLTAQLAGGMIGRSICLNNHRFLPIVRQHGGGLVYHLLNDCVGGGRSHLASFSAPKAVLFLSMIASLAT